MKNTDLLRIGKISVKVSVLALAAIVISVSVFGLVVVKGVISFDVGVSLSCALYVLTAFISAFCGAKAVAHGKIVAAATVVLMMIALQILIKSIFFAGQGIAVDWRMICAVVAILPAGLLASKKKQKYK